MTSITSEAVSGKKNPIAWSLLLSAINQLQEVTSCILSNISNCQFYITSPERLDLEMNLSYLSQLSPIYLEAISRVIGLDTEYIMIMEQFSILLTNSIYLLHQAVDTELFLWNPIPKYICNQRALKNHKEVTRHAKMFTHQIGCLREIISTCLPLSEKLQNEFDKLFAICQKFISMALDHAEELTLRSTFEGHEDTWHNIVCLMFVLIHNAIKSRAYLAGSYPISQTNLFSDLPKLNEVAKTLASEMRNMTNKMEDSEKLKNEKKLNPGLEYDVSEGWIDRLKSMRHLLLRKIDTYSSLSSSSPSHDNDDYNRGDEKNIYVFDADCLLLIMVFCRAQLNKSETFMSRKAYDPLNAPANHVGKNINHQRNMDIQRINGETKDDGDGGGDDGDDGGGGYGDGDDNEIIVIIKCIIRESHEQLLKETSPTPGWVEQLDEKRKRLDDVIPFLSSHAANKRLGSNLKTSLELLSSVVFQIEAGSRFSTIAEHNQFVQGRNSSLTLIEDLFRAAKGLLEDLRDVIKEGFHGASDLTRDELRTLGEISK